MAMNHGRRRNLSESPLFSAVLKDGEPGLAHAHPCTAVNAGHLPEFLIGPSLPVRDNSLSCTRGVLHPPRWADRFGRCLPGRPEFPPGAARLCFIDPRFPRHPIPLKLYPHSAACFRIQ